MKRLLLLLPFLFSACAGFSGSLAYKGQYGTYSLSSDGKAVFGNIQIAR